MRSSKEIVSEDQGDAEESSLDNSPAPESSTLDDKTMRASGQLPDNFVDFFVSNDWIDFIRHADFSRNSIETIEFSSQLAGKRDRNELVRARLQEADRDKFS